VNYSNPWSEMGSLEKRSFDELDRKFACYWVTNEAGKYGFLIESTENFELPEKNINLKGIHVTTGSNGNTSNFAMFLEESEDWQIFLALCHDLSKASENQENVTNFILAVQSRLTRWQKILQLSRKRPMSREMQMGLFTELACIKDIVEPRIGIKQALNSWVGPEFDKQDFLLDNFILEIKSFRTSKSPIANISSAGQLYSEKEPIYLVCYALTSSDNGKSILDLINHIEKLINADLNQSTLLESFHLKLDSYGYTPVFKDDEPLLNFLIDNINSYHVSDDFPKLTPQVVASEISNLKYGIELTKCSEFLVEIDDIFLGK
tara:strand:+ start:4230 stop:5189 length:960 start_codon:yes stop_codon:yes gene_type:complete